MQNRRNQGSPSPLSKASDPAAAREENDSRKKSTIIFSKRKRNQQQSSGSSALGLDLLQSSPPPPPNHKTLTTISDLKEFSSSRLEDIKRSLIERSHSEILKDLEASHSRLNKRFKMQTQACQQAMEEAERECKKISEKIDGSREAMKATYAEFMADVQATATRVSKASISELSKSLEKGIDNLRSKFGVPSLYN